MSNLTDITLKSYWRSQ